MVRLKNIRITCPAGFIYSRSDHVVSLLVGAHVEKHTVAMTFLRKAMHIIERILKPKANILSQEDLEDIREELKQAFNTEIMDLLDKIIQHKLI